MCYQNLWLGFSSLRWSKIIRDYKNNTFMLLILSECFLFKIHALLYVDWSSADSIILFWVLSRWRIKKPTKQIIMIDCYGIRVGVTRARPLTCCLVYKKLLVVQERVITIFTKQLQRVRRFGTIGLLGNLIKHISGLSDECQENSIPNIFSNSGF